MNHQQKGFGLVEVLVIVLILGLVGAASWFVFNRQKVDKNHQSQSAATEKSAVNVPNGWRTVTEKGITVSYPKAWDETQEDYQRLKIDGKVEGKTLSVGFGAPYGYRYEGAGSWTYVDADGAKVNDSKPKVAPAAVPGADSTIIVSGGDGGCGGSKLGFVYKGSVYSVSLPWECDAATHGSAGISGEVVAKDLERVIQSIQVN